MKQILLVIAIVLLVGCPTNRKPQPETKEVLTATPEPTKAAPNKLIANPIVEKEIRRQLKKPEGNLTKADLEKVTRVNLNFKKLTDVKDLEKLTKLETLHLAFNQLTDVKGLEKLTRLKLLWLGDNADLTKAQIDQLQKALPECGIIHNAKK